MFHEKRLTNPAAYYLRFALAKTTMRETIVLYLWKTNYIKKMFFLAAIVHHATMQRSSLLIFVNCLFRTTAVSAWFSSWLSQNHNTLVHQIIQHSDDFQKTPSKLWGFQNWNLATPKILRSHDFIAWVHNISMTHFQNVHCRIAHKY